ncbi:MAG: hypothetical protein P8R42_30260 [Candidatus Binatia bacterium]|nr:hypothetical protein [Candidatus Binatia bacterium]
MLERRRIEQTDDRLELEPGDACLFHAWMIHRVTYRRAPARPTFEIIYGFGPRPDFGQPAPPELFRNEEIRARLSAEARAFFDRSFD